MQMLYTLQLPSDVESVPLARRVVRGSLAQLGVDDQCVADVALAVTEACTNVISHAGGDGHIYEVRVEINPVDCHIRVIDTGAGFDAEALGTADDLAEGGRGVALMRALVDDLHFVPNEQLPGTVVHLTKHLVLDVGSPLAGFATRRSAATD